MKNLKTDRGTIPTTQYIREIAKFNQNRNLLALRRAVYDRKPGKVIRLNLRIRRGSCPVVSEHRQHPWQ